MTRPPDASTQILVDDLGDPAGPSLGDDAFRHLSRALRLRPGESVRAVDGAGGWVHCTFDGSTRLVPTGAAGLTSSTPPDPATVVPHEFIAVTV